MGQFPQDLWIHIIRPHGLVHPSGSLACLEPDLLQWEINYLTQYWMALDGEDASFEAQQRLIVMFWPLKVSQYWLNSGK